MESITRRLRLHIQENWKRLFLGSMSIAVFVAIWHCCSWYLIESGSRLALYFPYPSEVASAFVESFVTVDPYTGLFMTEHILSSLERILVGFGLALMVALPAGLLMGWIAAADAVGRPIVEIFRPIPPLAWIPLFTIVFGIVWGPIAIVFLGIFFPILLNVMFGVRSVDSALIDAARTLGATRKDIFTKVIFPSSMPYLMTGITVGLGIGWMCIVAAEMLAAVGGGVGYYILAMAQLGLFDYMFVGMAVIGVLNLLTTGVAALFENWLYRWMGMK